MRIGLDPGQPDGKRDECDYSLVESLTVLGITAISLLAVVEVARYCLKNNATLRKLANAAGRDAHTGFFYNLF